MGGDTDQVKGHRGERSHPQSWVTQEAGEGQLECQGGGGRWEVGNKEQDSPLTLLKSNRRSSLLGISLASGYSSRSFSPLAFV